MLERTPVVATPSTVRVELLRQHQAVRELLHQAQAACAAALQGKDTELARLIHDLRRRFRNHLVLEERLLIPVLSCADIWGPERARNLIEEHEQQGRELDELATRVESGAKPEELARALDTLAAELLRDMDEEERDYLQPREELALA
jgi:iron-sulfur cluster repair protein YtfE (RIC family)